jgi:hypothetical protein
MSARHVTASLLIRERLSASCCDCGKEAAQESESKVWTIWNREMIYCPACARHEGISPD